MAAIVSLREVVQELECLMEGCRGYINRKTGELFIATPTELAVVDEENEGDEDDEGLPEWQREVVVEVRAILASDDWLELPRRDGQEEYGWMEQFALSMRDPHLQELLLTSIQGRGAFRRFKDVLHRHHIQELWHLFRKQELAEIAAEWLKSQGIAYRQ